MNYAKRYQGAGISMNHKLSDRVEQYGIGAHELLELIYVQRGDVTHIIDGKEYHPGNNSLIIVHPLDYHTTIIGDREPYDRYVIQIAQDLISPEICMQIPQELDVVEYDGNMLIRDLFQKFDHYIERFEGEFLRKLLINLAEEILCNLILDAQQQDVGSAFTSNELITRAVRYINDNIERPLSLNEIAEELNIAQSYLHRQFMKYMKVSPKKFIMSRKLTMARQDLCSGKSATDVSAKYGFVDYSSFYRNYTRYFGHKPSEAEKYKLLINLED